MRKQAGKLMRERKITSSKGGEGALTGERSQKHSSEIGVVSFQEVERGCQTVGSVKQIHTRISHVM